MATFQNQPIDDEARIAMRRYLMEAKKKIPMYDTHQEAWNNLMAITEHRCEKGISRMRREDEKPKYVPTYFRNITWG